MTRGYFQRAYLTSHVVPMDALGQHAAEDLVSGDDVRGACGDGPAREGAGESVLLHGDGRVFVHTGARVRSGGLSKSSARTRPNRSPTPRSTCSRTPLRQHVFTSGTACGRLRAA